MYDRMHVTLQQRTFESLATEAEQAFAAMHAHPDTTTHGYGTAAVAAEDTHTLVGKTRRGGLGGTSPARNNNYSRRHYYHKGAQGAQGPSPKCILLDPRMNLPYRPGVSQASGWAYRYSNHAAAPWGIHAQHALHPGLRGSGW
jgi:hypothetical protein